MASLHPAFLPMRTLITVADDFGLSPSINEAIEIASRDGILTSASLMVGAPAAADAVRRARALGDKLRVGLHLVVIEGPAVLRPTEIPALRALGYSVFICGSDQSWLLGEGRRIRRVADGA